MTTPVTDVGWPAARLGEALAGLARHTGLRGRAGAPALAPPGGEPSGGWVEAAAAWMGLEAEPVEAPYLESSSFWPPQGPHC